MIAALQGFALNLVAAAIFAAPFLATIGAARAVILRSR